MYVCLDSNIFLDELEELANKNFSIFIMIPIRLGIDSIQPQYLTQCKELFQFPQNVGIAGGKDHMALYLCRIEDATNPKAGFFYLDPHFVHSSIPRKAVMNPNLSESLRPYLSQYHTTTLRCLAPNDMCTSLAPGFYIRNKEDF